MKILYLTLEPPFDARLTARGNAVRARQLGTALASAGVEVQQAWRRPYDDSPVKADPWLYHNAGELAALLDRFRPDAILAGYWALLADLPATTAVPVVLDFIAPRPLEAMYEPPATRDLETARLLTALARADGFIVANERQRHFLLPYLLMAGKDLRRDVPVVEIPIAALPPFHTPQPPGERLGVVAGGVEWPWRRQQGWIDAAAAFARARRRPPAVQLVVFGGEYPRIVQHGADHFTPPPASEPLVRLDLVSYHGYSHFLQEHAHLGLELADENLERYFSQSFRAVEFLRHGLPLILNRYLALAAEIEAYGAGWAVADQRELGAALEAACDPNEWAGRAANARLLAEERFDARHTIAPLITLVERLGRGGSGEFEARGAPFRSPLLGAALKLEGNLKRAGKAGRRMLHAGRFSLARMLRETIRRWLAHRPASGRPASGHVVMISRSDLFPADHGGAVKVVETARGLSRCGREVAIVSDRRDIWWHVAGGEVRERRYPWWLRLATLPRGLSSVLHLGRDVPHTNAFLYLPLSDNSYILRTLYCARRLDSRLYHAEFPAFARPGIWARTLRGGKVVLVEHNVEYARLREQEPGLEAAGYERLKGLELTLCNQSDAVVCVSDNDRDRLAADGVDRSRLHVIPHGVDLAKFDAAAATDWRGRLDWPAGAAILVYHGTYQYPPNLEALRIAAQEVLPRLEKRGIEARILAVGKLPPPGGLHPNIHFTGSIDNVATALKAADVAIVPLLKGGGTRMKIIDYFACGVPVVSTSKGIEGIPVSAGCEAFIEDDWSLFTERIATLLADPARRQAMIARARAFVEPLDWCRLAERYIELYRTIGAD